MIWTWNPAGSPEQLSASLKWHLKSYNQGQSGESAVNAPKKPGTILREAVRLRGTLCRGRYVHPLIWNQPEKERTMSTRHTNDSKARSLSPTTAALKLTNRMDLRLQLLLVCTAAAVTTAGLTA